VLIAAPGKASRQVTDACRWPQFCLMKPNKPP
jgi:hypothetical protein